MGSDCGSVGRAVASDTRDPVFKSSQWQNFTHKLMLTVEKSKIKKKEAEKGHLTPLAEGFNFKILFLILRHHSGRFGQSLKGKLRQSMLGNLSDWRVA